MTKCCSGKHTWLEQEDAAKCCHPDWVRIMDSGVTMPYFRVWISFRWVKRSDLNEENQRGAAERMTDTR